VRFGRLGAFESHGVLYAEVEPSPELVDLYLRTKAGMTALGERTYDYDATTWRPHLTLSCGHWSREAVDVIRAAFPRLDRGFVADRVQVSRLEDGRWVTIRDLPLGMPLPLAS
jgi:2'-5' RNA ligase